MARDSAHPGGIADDTSDVVPASRHVAALIYSDTFHMHFDKQAMYRIHTITYRITIYFSKLI